MTYFSLKPLHTIPPLHPLPRLASKSSSPSCLATRWAEFQGADNWDTLLDPLDPTLRSEILRYGRFVQSAYSSCDLDPSSPSFASCRFSKHSLLPSSSGYRVTRNLYATSGSRLPPCLSSLTPPSLSLQTTWIGFIAVCNDDAELARLGRRDIVISIRGTVTPLEWLDNLRATLTHLTPTTRETLRFSSRPPYIKITVPPDQPMVERGFWSLFTSSTSSHPCLRDQLRDEILRLIAEQSNYETTITITGHSLGAALAVLAADDLSAMLGSCAPMITVFSFAGPRVGNSSFRKRMEEQGSKVLRIVNVRDIVTKVPGFLDGQEKKGGFVNWLISRTGWVYANVGRELRVGGGSGNVALCHDLSHYLQLVLAGDAI